MSDGMEIKDGVLLKYTGSDEELHIPEGVISIAREALSKNKTIKKLFFPKSIKTIGFCSIWYCHNLEYIYIPEGKIDVIDPIFSCNNLKIIEMDCDVHTERYDSKKDYFNSTHFESKVHPDFVYSSKASIDELCIHNRCVDMINAAIFGYAKKYMEGYSFSEELILANDKFISKRYKKLLSETLARPYFLAYLIQRGILTDRDIKWIENNNLENLEIKAILLNITKGINKIDDLSLDKPKKEKTVTELKKEWKIQEKKQKPVFSKYELEDDEIALLKYKWNDNEVYIPEMIGKKKVAKIFGCFSNNLSGFKESLDQIKLVDVPKTVRLIDDYSFSYLDNKMQVIIHGEDTKIGSAFACSNAIIIAPRNSKAIEFAKKNKVDFSYLD